MALSFELILALLAPKKKVKNQRRSKKVSFGPLKRWSSTKIHAAVDGLGNPIRLQLTPGQDHDLTQARSLIEGLKTEAVLADSLIKFLEQQGILVVIPPKKNRTEARDCDFCRYKERHLVECFFTNIKHSRRIFSHFDKLAGKYLAFLQFISAMIWLR